jgi:ribosomal protein S17
MKRSILLFVLVLFAAGAALAHGKEEHLMGTVTAMTDSSITVQTKAKDPIVVYTTVETKYEKSGAAASMKELKLGDRVVIHAARINDKLVANEVQFGAATHAASSY